MKDKIKFVMFADKAVMPAIFALKKSIDENYNESEYEIFIGITKECQEFESYLKHNNFHVENIDNWISDSSEMIFGHVSVTSYARFYMFDIFKNLENENNIIYIDMDVLITNRIDENYFKNKNENYAISDKPADKDFFRNWRWLNWITSKHEDINKVNLLKFEGDTYFNAGVIFINNVEKMKSLFSKSIERLKLSEDMIDDQNLMNFYNNDEVKVLNEFKLNCQPFKTDFNEKTEIIHFAGRFKPWTKDINFFKEHKDFQKIIDLYNKYSNRIKILITDRYTEQVRPLLEELINNFKEIDFYATIDTNSDIEFEKIESSLERKDIYKGVSSEKNDKILNEYDIIIGQSFLIHYSPEFKKRKHENCIFELFHGTLVKELHYLNFYENRVDYFLSPNRYTTEMLKRLGYGEQMIIKDGYPRLDYYSEMSDNFSLDPETEYNKNFDKLVENVSKKEDKFVLFAPSWLNTRIEGELVTFTYNLDSILEQLNENEILIVSMHYNQFVMKNCNYIWDKKFDGRLIFNTIDFKATFASKLMFSNRVVRMITDYSSIIFDYANVRGFDKISFFSPINDSKQDQETKDLYFREYSNYGSVIKGFDLYKMTPQEMEEWFTFYVDPKNPKTKGTENLAELIKNISAKKFLIKN